MILWDINSDSLGYNTQYSWITVSSISWSLGRLILNRGHMTQRLFVEGMAKAVLLTQANRTLLRQTPDRNYISRIFQEIRLLLLCTWNEAQFPQKETHAARLYFDIFWGVPGFLKKINPGRYCRLTLMVCTQKNPSMLAGWAIWTNSVQVNLNHESHQFLGVVKKKHPKKKSQSGKSIKMAVILTIFRYSKLKCTVAGK